MESDYLQLKPPPAIANPFWNGLRLHLEGEQVFNLNTPLTDSGTILNGRLVLGYAFDYSQIHSLTLETGAGEQRSDYTSESDIHQQNTLHRDWLLGMQHCNRSPLWNGVLDQMSCSRYSFGKGSIDTRLSQNHEDPDLAAEAEGMTDSSKLYFLEKSIPIFGTEVSAIPYVSATVFAGLTLSLHPPVDSYKETTIRSGRFDLGPSIGISFGKKDTQAPGVVDTPSRFVWYRDLPTLMWMQGHNFLWGRWNDNYLGEDANDSQTLIPQAEVTDLGSLELIPPFQAVGNYSAAIGQELPRRMLAQTETLPEGIATAVILGGIGIAQIATYTQDANKGSGVAQIVMVKDLAVDRWILKEQSPTVRFFANQGTNFLLTVIGSASKVTALETGGLQAMGGLAYTPSPDENEGIRQTTQYLHYGIGFLREQGRWGNRGAISAFRYFQNEDTDFKNTYWIAGVQLYTPVLALQNLYARVNDEAPSNRNTSSAAYAYTGVEHRFDRIGIAAPVLQGGLRTGMPYGTRSNPRATFGSAGSAGVLFSERLFVGVGLAADSDFSGRGSFEITPHLEWRGELASLLK